MEHYDSEVPSCPANHSNLHFQRNTHIPGESQTETIQKYTFHCYGHPNIQAKHIRTIEFTKDTELSERGDCIIGIRADFNKEELKKLCGKILITISIPAMNTLNQPNGSISSTIPNDQTVLQDSFHAVVNPKFDSDHEIVFRKSLYPSPRTLGHFLNKGANRIDRNLIKCLQDSNVQMTVTIEEKGIKKKKKHPIENDL